MITHYPHSSLGGANHGWLDTRHHFSFAHYYDPQKMGHGNLRVINDDIIQPRMGFDPHGHRDMEIITYVRRGAITHRDSLGNQGRTTAGNVQVMTAGTGIMHSEYNMEDEVTQIFQIWIQPDQSGLAPRWDTAEFPTENVTDKLKLLVADRNAPLTINQSARIFAGRLAAGAALTHRAKGKSYMLVSDGTVDVNGMTGATGDGFAAATAADYGLTTAAGAEILIIEVDDHLPALGQADA